MPQKKRFVKFILPLFILIFALSSFAEEGLYKIYIDDFSGGQNSFDISISANQGVLVKNAVINRRGRLSKRNGVEIFGSGNTVGTGLGDLSNTAFTGIGRFTPTATNDYLITASGEYVQRSTSAASWESVNTANQLSSGYDTEFIQCNKLLITLNGVDRPPYYDGVTWTAGVDIDASPPIAKYGCWFKNYLFLAHGSVEKDWVWYSENLYPIRFTATDVFKVNTGDGQAIQALKPFKLNELIIYKERSVWLLDISATSISSSTLQPIIEDIGLIAPRSVASVGNDQWFLSSEPIGVRSLIRTDLDKIKTSLISQPIQDIFDGSGSTVINETHIDKAAAIFFDNKYLLAVASGDSTVNDLVLVYDAIANGWYQITGWYVADWEIFDNNLYFIDSTDGRVLRAFYRNNDIASGPIATSVNEHGSFIASSEQVQGVEWHYESKEFDFDSPELFKTPDALEVICESSGDYTQTVYIQLDRGGWQELGTMSLAGESTNLPQDLPFTLSSEKLAREVFDLTGYGDFRKIQVGFDQDASDEMVELRDYTIFGKKRKWRKEYQ